MPGSDHVFPQGYFDRPSQYSDESFVLNGGGLTKREFFAAMAMQGIKANSIPGSHHVPINAVREAIEIADALIAELEK